MIRSSIPCKVEKIRVYPPSPALIARGYDAIVEPYWEGVRWHMGLPEICTHEHVVWNEDFYVGSDHGRCQDCKENLSRSLRNVGQDGMRSEFAGAKRMPVPKDRHPEARNRIQQAIFMVANVGAEQADTVLTQDLAKWRENYDVGAFENAMTYLMTCDVTDKTLPVMLCVLGNSHALKDDLPIRKEFLNWLRIMTEMRLGQERSRDIMGRLR